MTTASDVSRRGFLGLFGGALTLGFNVGCGGAQAKMIRHAEQTGELTPNMYVSVKKDGRVGLFINKAEIGQGVTSAYATLVAEELDVPVESIDFAFADSMPEYKTTFFMQLTGGSMSTQEAFMPLRRAGASARVMLVMAAAQDWNVAPSECRTENGTVFHDRSSRKVGYGDLTLKASKLSIPDSPPLKPRGQFKFIGKRNLRVDARGKVDGTAKFGMDVVVPNMVRAVIIHGPVYGSEAKAVRADAARKMQGVVGIFPVTRGVAVVAEKYWQALAASKLVEVDWNEAELAHLDSEAMRIAARDYPKTGESVLEEGNVKKAVENATIKIEAIYEAPYLAHAPMEPQNCTVHVKGDTVEVWAPCQSPTILQVFIADSLGIDEKDVLVHSTFIGGGFGRRITGDWAVQAALISREVKRPVQTIWSREDDMTQAYYRPQGIAKMRGAVSADGSKASAIAAHLITQSVAVDSDIMVKAAMVGVPHAVQNVLSKSFVGMVGSNTVPDVIAMEGLANTPYALDNVDMSFTPIACKLPIASWRSVGNSVTGFFMEGFVDELARAAKQDPYQFRRNMLKPGSRQLPVLDRVAAMAKWGEKKPGIGRGIARHFSFDSEVAEVVDVEIVDGRIKVRRVWAAVDCGIAVNPDIVKAQVEGSILFGLSAALDQRITIKNGVVQQTNFDTFPVIRMHETPEIIVEVLDIDRDPTGIGEPGLPPIAPAVANAIFDLTGIRLRRMPLQLAYDEARK